jgi:hypothetical protein
MSCEKSTLEVPGPVLKTPMKYLKTASKNYNILNISDITFVL